ncbi:hypothetical protein ACFQBQ_13545 [Granulicella cerasi]|uniref:Uncharacterized protein n=1 Tax=Granulicella cerasi TaxID=741063 RepID=A0ABW1ZAV5_9BACT|nr:hypothetical protein [Granulicella cerasi]
MNSHNDAPEPDVVEADPLEPRKLDPARGVRGKYFSRAQEGTNVVLIAPDLLETFPDSESVNRALRTLKEIADRTARRAS